MNDQALTRRQRMARQITVDLAIMGVIGIGLALIGPFGSFVEPLPNRLVSWVGFAYLGYAIYAPMSGLVERTARWLDLPLWGLWIVAVLLATLPMSAAVWTMGFWSRDFRWPSLEQGLTTYFYVLIVGGAVSAIFYALAASKADVSIPNQAMPIPLQTDAETDLPTFFDRLTPSLGSDLIALEMEDHYVRAHTALGNEMVLMRMRDAVAELNDLNGIQVHRSWWVARGAVEGVKREGRNVKLILAGGIEAPVSRANVSVLKEAGWI